ncbi:MAG: carboxylesterase family protein [Bifidobacteriaceae bacterium]|jgi:para-nitrobenzyl esterase|nr:carboxylesterase family protein [Bifidobacteriaceae bacterium]
MTETYSTPPGAPTTVTAPAGTIRGLTADGVSVFRGIPYAVAPTGSLRFAPPVACDPFSAVFDAASFGPISIQDIDPLPITLPGTEANFYHRNPVMSEDCLNLNIWSPNLQGSAPVLVWIHGGAFMCGSGTGAWTDGSRYAQNHGIVVVSINYRLGILGGLYLGDHSAGSANFGLLDQIEALRWVRRNIAAFGGDPDRVTVSGQSAGAMSTALLLASPLTTGLFRRAIVESGHLAANIDVDSALMMRNTIARQLHLDPKAPDLVDQLRQLSTLRIMAAQRANSIALAPFPSVTDGVSLPADPLGSLAAGDKDGIELIVGINEEENRLFDFTGWSRDPTVPLEQYLSAYVGTDDLPLAVALYRSIPGISDSDRCELAATDHDWGPAAQLADVYSSRGNTVFNYEFAWKSKAQNGRLGSAHLVELPFVFDNLHQPGVDDLLGDGIAADPGAERLAAAINAAWAGFIREGRPGPELGRWTAYSPDRRATLIVDVEPRLVLDNKEDRLRFWANHRAHAPLSVILGKD